MFDNIIYLIFAIKTITIIIKAERFLHENDNLLLKMISKWKEKQTFYEGKRKGYYFAIKTIIFVNIRKE